MHELLSLPLTSLFVGARGSFGECDVDTSAKLIYPCTSFRPCVHEVRGVQVIGVKSPPALQVYGQDLFKPTDLLLRRLTELLYEDDECPGIQLRFNQGDSLYIFKAEKVAVMVLHLDDANEGMPIKASGEIRALTSSSHNDASSSGQMFKLDAWRPTFQLINGLAENDTLEQLVNKMRFGNSQQADSGQEGRQQRVKNALKFQKDTTRKGAVCYSKT